MLTYVLFGILTTQCIALCATNSVFMSVMHTVLLFCTSSLLLLQLGYEFMAIINVLIYVGALAVLFLFVVMLIHVPASTLYGYVLGVGVLSLIGVVGTKYLNVTVLGSHTHNLQAMYEAVFAMESLTHIGQAFYVHYGDILVLNSIVLTVALLGALTIAHTRA
jgi:NADH:ubiquinone oxidoreductase subunit 6 (subunit J)